MICPTSVSVDRDLASLNEAVLTAFFDHIPTCRCVRRHRGQLPYCVAGARRFLGWGRDQGLVTTGRPAPSLPPLIVEFEAWMIHHRNVQPITLRHVYRRTLLRFVDHVGDDRLAVAHNRVALRHTHALPADPLWLRQVHGTAVVDADVLAAHTLPEADAALTRAPGRVLAILTADCLPVVFSADDGSVIAAAHAGWRGLAAGVLEATVAAMRHPATRIAAWMGPAIRQPAFEVGPEVRALLGPNGLSCAEFVS